MRTPGDGSHGFDDASDLLPVPAFADVRDGFEERRGQLAGA